MGTCRSKNKLLKQSDSQPIHPSITDLQPATTYLIHPNTASSKSADFHLITGPKIHCSQKFKRRGY